MQQVPFHTAIAAALTLLGTSALAVPAGAEDVCVDCLKVRVGPPMVVRGPLPDELDAPFAALRLPDGTMRGFSANGTTYAVDGASLEDMGGPRRPVLDAGAPGSINDCGRWLTSVIPSHDRIIGFVHQERLCDYDVGRTDKSMAIATSADLGLTWTDLGTVITGRDTPQPDRITGEGDCTMVDGHDGYLYAYCLRNTDWQTIAARAPFDDLTDWRKYHDGAWDEPGLGGEASAIGFLGPGAGYLREHDLVAAVATDPWFGGVRLSLSADKVSFSDLDEPLVPIDGSEWNRPAATALLAYDTILDPLHGGNSVGDTFVLAYIYVPPNAGFESRYLVQQEVSLALEDAPVPTQVGLALTRWSGPEGQGYVTSTGPLTGENRAYRLDTIVAHILARAPEGVASIRLVECSTERSGHLDQIIAEDGTCEGAGYRRDRTAGWLFTTEEPGSIPVYRCMAADTHFASASADCEGLGTPEFLLGYGLAP